MGMHAGQPRPFDIGLNQPGSLARVLQRDAEFRGSGGGAGGGDGADPDLWVDANADLGIRRQGGHQCRHPFQFLEIVDIQRGTLPQRLFDFPQRLGGGVEHDLVRQETGAAGLGELAGAGDLASHSALA